MSRQHRTAPHRDAPPVGLFVGLATLDLVQRVDSLPGPDAKATAGWQQLSAGGPALNAAVTFAALGGRATLVTRIGAGPVAGLVAADLSTHHVSVLDLAGPGYAPSVSAIAVDAGSGARQVISTDAGRASPPGPEALDAMARDLRADVVVLDGHHADLATAVLDRLDHVRHPVVLDAGRWKPAMTDLLPRCTHVICSADFRLHGDLRGEALLDALIARGTHLAAITCGADPIRWRTASDNGAVGVPRVEAIDTLGAGDALHGAYAWALASGAATPADLGFAASVAAWSTTSRGTRAWLSDLPDLPRPTRPAPRRNT